MIQVGPFSIKVVAIVISAVVAWRVPLALRGQDAARRRAAAALVLDALLAGLVAARLGYVLRWWSEYLAGPWSILAIGDGGFYWWAGLPVALVFLIGRTRAAGSLRRPALIGIVAGMATWAVMSGAVFVLQRSATGLPELELATLEGAVANPAAFQGRPLVLNLWATWCPPCRREMPVFAQAQRQYPGAAFLMINQGEEAPGIQAFLEQEGLAFDHVLIDSLSASMQALGTRALPSTFFFDADGRMVDSHLGELTRARLRDVMQRRFSITPSPPTEDTP
ncbi:MAG: TlpA family protein disulfide reductase [Xanthomonadales bacterium]|nr:TlpA family protein disulfide reductase [Xanthomonadales bacterium]